ncbi:MAG: MFS transporter [Novosphingobium sp.]
MNTPATAIQEWRQYWTLPVAAALGYSTAVLLSFGLGPFIQPIQQEFGWSRASISMGITIAGLTSAAFGIPMGMVVDRWGPRRVGLVGLVLMPAAFALLGTATGSLTNWLMLWGCIAIANLGLQSTVWTSAVASRFETSRGLAFAMTLSGGSLTSTVLPLIATAFIIAFDWRVAFMAVGGIWFMATFPLALLFFRGAQDTGGKWRRSAAAPVVDLPGLTVAEAIRTSAFYKLLAASGLFAFTAIGTIIHFVPILTDRGATPMGAAGIASIVGIFSFIGRLGTGLLLDRFSGRLVGAGIFLLPVISCALLLFDGANPTSQASAAAFFGFTVGAEIDVIAFLISRHFGLKSYGVIFGAIVTALATGTALGPLAAGAAFDRFGGYSEFIILTAVLMGLSSLAVASLEEA